MKSDWISISIDEEQFYYPDNEPEVVIYNCIPNSHLSQDSTETTQSVYSKYFGSPFRACWEESFQPNLGHTKQDEDGEKPHADAVGRSPVWIRGSSDSSFLSYYEGISDQSLDFFDKDGNYSTTTNEDFEDYYSMRERFKNSPLNCDMVNASSDITVENAEHKLGNVDLQDACAHEGFQHGMVAKNDGNDAQCTDSPFPFSLKPLWNLRAYYFSKCLFFEQLQLKKNQFELLDRIAVMNISESTDLRPLSTLKIEENVLENGEETKHPMSYEQVEKEPIESLRFSLKQALP